MTDLVALAVTIKAWGRELGFADIRITDVDLSHREAGFQAWLDKGYHGEMDYMASHGMKRRPSCRIGAGHGARDYRAHALSAA